MPRRINVSLPDDILADLELLAEELAVTNRSKLIAVAVKLLLEETRKRKRALAAEVQFMVREELLHKLKE